MSDELKPCAHCCGEAQYSEESRFHISWVYCTHCGAASGYRNTKAEAIAAWNARADEPKVIQNAENYKFADDARPKVIKNAEKYKLADDSGPQVITNAEKHELADSREKLEADVHQAADDMEMLYCGEKFLDTRKIISWLDRQAAITRAEVFEDGEYDCMTCGAKRELQGRVDSLTAEVQAQQDDIAELTDERELYRENMIAQTKRVAELTAERDEWKAKAEYQQEILDCDCRDIRDFQNEIDHLTAERDRLQKVVQVQAESFQKLERELKEANDTCNTLRASVAGLKETVERFKARDGA